MEDINPPVTVITLKVNGLKSYQKAYIFKIDEKHYLNTCF